MAKIKWTNNARTEYHALLRFAKNSSQKQAEEIRLQLNVLLKKVQIFNRICPSHPKLPEFRRCVFNKNFIVVYDLSDNEITLISVFDARSAHPLN